MLRAKRPTPSPDDGSEADAEEFDWAAATLEELQSIVSWGDETDGEGEGEDSDGSSCSRSREPTATSERDSGDAAIAEMQLLLRDGTISHAEHGVLLERHRALKALDAELADEPAPECAPQPGVPIFETGESDGSRSGIAPKWG